MKKIILTVFIIMGIAVNVSAQQIIGPTKIPMEELAVTKEYKLNYKSNCPAYFLRYNLYIELF